MTGPKSFQAWWTEEQRRVRATELPQPRKPTDRATELPQPRKPTDRAAEPPALATAPAVLTGDPLVDELCRATGLAVTLLLDFEKLGPSLSNLWGAYTGTGHYARDGSGASRLVGMLGRNGPRQIVLQIIGPGHARPETLEPEMGAAADITNPRVLDWLERAVTGIRDTPITEHVHVLIVLTPEVVPAGALDRVTRDRLVAIAADARCCMAVVTDVPGYAPDGRPQIALIPSLAGSPWPGDVHAST